MRTAPRSRSLGTAFTIISTLVAAVVLLPCPPAQSTGDAGIALKTRIVASTVYSDRALVTRSGSVDVKQGLATIVCDDLPQGFVESSLQVEGRGTASARILGVDVTKVQGRVTESQRYTDLKSKLDRLTARSDSLHIELNATSGSIEFLNDYAKYPFSKPDEKAPADVFRTQDWKTVIEFLGTERVKAAQRADALAKRTAKVDEEIEWIKGQLADMRTKGDWTKRVVIEGEIASAGDLTLDISYSVTGATWSPEYTVRFDTETETLGLSYNARIQQYTGEDWSRVRTELSTAEPRLGAAPPEITPRYLERIVRPMKKAADVLRVRGGAEEAEVKDEAMAEALGAPALPMASIERVEAEAAATAFAATFAIPKPVDLPTGSDPKRVLILEEKLAGRISRYSAPRLSQNVFVKADITNTLDVPLLGGPADVYIESAPAGGRAKASTFVGKEALRSVGTGQEFAVHLGIDQDVKATYKLEKKEYLTREGAAVRKIRYSYIATLESFKKAASSLVLQDRIPVSTVKEIKVTSVDLEPKPAEERDDGIVTWNLNLAPMEKKEVRIAYTIEFPGDWPEFTLNLE